MNEQDTAVDNLLAEKKIDYKVTYVGETERRDGDKPWKCDQWTVVFDKANGRWPGSEYISPEAIKQDYYTGLGLRSKPKSRFHDARPQKPTAASVLYSLLLEGEACEQSFSEWCGNLGYDTDSIKSLNIYQACEKTGRAMRRLFDRKTREQLSKILQDY